MTQVDINKVNHHSNTINHQHKTISTTAVPHRILINPIKIHIMTPIITGTITHTNINKPKPVSNTSLLDLRLIHPFQEINKN